MPIKHLILTLLCFSASQIHAQKVGLVLSGGGATGLSHIGVLMALEEHDIPIDYLTGTSVGALVGGMYAAGYSPKEIADMVTSEKFQMMSQGLIEDKFMYYFKQYENNPAMLSLRLNKDSIRQTSLPVNLVSPAMMDYEMMIGFIGAAAAARNNFDSLFIPFRCVASDISNKKSIVFKSGELHQAVRASMSYPFYMKPIRVNGVLLFDGGLYNNFPANIMYDDFLPDVMIGSNVSGPTALPDEENILSQIKNMIIVQQEYNLRCDNGIIIYPKTNINTFDFKDAAEAIQSGYDETIKNIDSIKTLITRRISKEERNLSREKFRNKWPEVRFDKINMTGINKKESIFVRKTLLKKKEGIITEKQLKPRYFRIWNDERIGFIYPHAVFNDTTKAFTLNLDIKKDKEFKVEFGGNFASKPINTGFVGLQYHLLRKSAWTFGVNSHFGKFYSAVNARVRFEPPTKLPFYIEPEFNIHRFDYFKSFSTFFEDVKPSFIVQYEEYYGLNFGLPVGNKGKIVMFGRYAELIDKYYQTDIFRSTDTTDRTEQYLFTPGIYYERNSLNKKQNANEGSYLYLGIKYISSYARSIPGSTSILRDTTIDYHYWGLIKFEYQNYYKQRGALRLGIHLEGVYSLPGLQPFLNNYTVTILNTPAYQPIPEAKTLFLSDFRAFQYISAGHQFIFHFVKNLDWRIEGYAFQPLSAVQPDVNNKPQYSEPLKKRYFIASSSIVFHSPVGPASLAFNYYPGQKNQFSLLFNFGYIIFNRYAIR